MKKHIGTFFLVLLMVSCLREHRNHWKNTLFVFYQSSDSLACSAGEGSAGDCQKGKLFLTSEGKALYFFQCSKTDSIKYFRGTYKVTDSIVECVFDSRLNRGKDPQKERPHFQDITKQHVTLKPTGCEPGNPILVTGDLHYIYDSTKARVFTYFTKADLNTYNEFCNSVSAKPSLVDFVCQPGGDTAYATAKMIDLQMINRITDHYKNKNPRGRMQRAENDTSVNLSFSYLKKKRGEDNSPYLYVTIPKSRNAYLFGDLSGDENAEIVASPYCTEGADFYWQDIFVFIGKGANHDLLPVVSSMDIARCPRNSYNGSFVPQKIQDRMLIGTTTCFTDDDAACCPSVKMETRYILEGKKLKLSKKEKSK